MEPLRPTQPKIGPFAVARPDPDRPADAPQGPERVFVGHVVANVERPGARRPVGPVTLAQDVQHGVPLVPIDRRAALDDLVPQAGPQVPAPQDGRRPVPRLVRHAALHAPQVE